MGFWKEVSFTQPTIPLQPNKNPVCGDLYFDPQTQKMYVYSANAEEMSFEIDEETMVVCTELVNAARYDPNLRESWKKVLLLLKLSLPEDCPTLPYIAKVIERL